VNPRLAAGALLAAAAAAYFGLAVPFRTRAEAARAEFQQVRDQRRQSRARLGTLERREAARQRAAALLAAAAASPGSDASGIVRRAVVTSLEAVRVSPVKLTVRPARAPVGASLSLSAEGRFAEVVRLAGHLVRPGSGLILERVQMLSRPAGLLLLDLQAIGALQAAR
jgi:hypothetical protein